MNILIIPIVVSLFIQNSFGESEENDDNAPQNRILHNLGEASPQSSIPLCRPQQRGPVFPQSENMNNILPSQITKPSFNSVLDNLNIDNGVPNMGKSSNNNNPHLPNNRIVLPNALTLNDLTGKNRIGGNDYDNPLPNMKNSGGAKATATVNKQVAGPPLGPGNNWFNPYSPMRGDINRLPPADNGIFNPNKLPPGAHDGYYPMSGQHPSLPSGTHNGYNIMPGQFSQPPSEVHSPYGPPYGGVHPKPHQHSGPYSFYDDVDEVINTSLESSLELEDPSEHGVLYPYPNQYRLNYNNPNQQGVGPPHFNKGSPYDVNGPPGYGHYNQMWSPNNNYPSQVSPNNNYPSQRYGPDGPIRNDNLIQPWNLPGNDRLNGMHSGRCT